MNIYRFNQFSYVRIIVCLVAWFTLFTLYSHRVNLSVNIIGMVAKNNTHTPGTKAYEIFEKTEKAIWNESDKELVLLSFNIGYLLAHIPGGMLLFVFGLRNVMLVCLFASTVLTFVSSWVGTSKWAFFVVRILIGAANGCLYPIIHEVIAHHAPPSERTWLLMLTHTGNLLCLVFTFPLGGYLIANVVDGWKVLFYITGGFGVASFILWFIFVYGKPGENPWMTEKEQNYIVNSIYPNGAPPHLKLSDVPFKKIFTCKHIYILACPHFGKMFILYMNLIGLIKYLNDYFNLTASQSSNYATIPFIIDFLFQLVYPKLVTIMKEKGISISHIRRLNTFIGALGCSSFLLVASFVPDTKCLVGVTLISLSLLFIAAYQAGYFTAIVEIAPQFSGIDMAIINVMGSLAGVVQRSITAAFNNYAGGPKKGYFYSFVTTAVVSFLISMVYVIFGTAERQPWAIVGPKSAKYDVVETKLDSGTTESNELSGDIKA